MPIELVLSAVRGQQQGVGMRCPDCPRQDGHRVGQLGSGGGGDAVPYKINGNGFRVTYRIPSTYLGSEQTHTWGKRLPVRPGAGYMFATYPAAGCQVPFRVTTAAGR